MKKQDILENQANIAYLSLGSNLGKKKKNLELAKALLNSTGVKIICASSYYKTKSWPNKNFPDYLNAVILINTNNDLIELFKKIKTIEKKVGRTKSPKNYPRICDIDIIDFNGFCLSTSYKDNEITIPHKNMHKRSFVLLPLFELNKTWTHPVLKRNIIYLINSFDIKDFRSIKII